MQNTNFTFQLIEKKNRKGNMKIGIFGGSFNPPHNMHFKLLEELVNRKLLDEVVIVPTGKNYPKETLISEEHRLQMLKKMFSKNKRISISDYELKKQLTYTYQTLEHFQERYPNDELYFICGSDNLKDLKNWKRAEYLLTQFHFMVIPRDSDKIEELNKLYPENQAHIHIIPLVLDNISSTQIRKRITAGLDYHSLVPEEVYTYIQDHQIYQ